MIPMLGPTLYVLRETGDAGAEEISVALKAELIYGRRSNFR